MSATISLATMVPVVMTHEKGTASKLEDLLCRFHRYSRKNLRLYGKQIFFSCQLKSVLDRQREDAVVTLYMGLVESNWRPSMHQVCRTWVWSKRGGKSIKLKSTERHLGVCSFSLFTYSQISTGWTSMLNGFAYNKCEQHC